MMRSKKLPLASALLWIVGSMIFVSGSVFTGLRYYLQREKDKSFNPAYWIKAIIQTGPEKEALKTDYFAELLDLSSDQPFSLYQFDIEAARKTLLCSPVIKHAEIKKLPPYTLYIDYHARKPVAWLLDYENMAIDEEGFFFPMYPFFTPKNLPEIYLGSTLSFEDKWNISLENNHLKLAFNLLKITKEIGTLKRIDVSNAFAESYGMREIVLICEDHSAESIHTRFLRLTPKNYPQELGNFIKLRERFLETEKNLPSTTKVIDLRISKLGYIEEL